LGLSQGLVVLGSLAIAFHLLAVTLGVLAAPSGPWPAMDGVNLATPPQFAFSAHALVRPYLQLVKMTHNYHFLTNRPGAPGAYFEARLWDAAGQELATVRFPDASANLWVRHRQGLLARALADDQPVMPPQGEVIAPPQQQVPTVPIWDMVENRRLTIRRVPEHLIPRDRPVFSPSEWSLLLARSYGRYLCRAHGAASAEVVRHTRDPIPPAVMFMDNVQAAAFDELISTFGEVRP
jgi:hypothetical protein